MTQSVFAFVFTDIEGSTRLLATLGDDAYGEVLEAHWKLLREAWSKHGGRDFRTEGDGGFAVFADAASALAACVDAQLGISGHPWPRDLRVRMGVHGASWRTTRSSTRCNR
jgi:class 3 adenylate cyclase